MGDTSFRPTGVWIGRVPLAGPLSQVKERHFGCFVEESPTLHGRKTAASPRLKGAEEEVKQKKT